MGKNLRASFMDGHMTKSRGLGLAKNIKEACSTPITLNSMYVYDHFNPSLLISILFYTGECHT